MPLPPVTFMALNDQSLVEPDYDQQLLAELHAIIAAVPLAQLAIQWDLAAEIAVLEDAVARYSSARTPVISSTCLAVVSGIRYISIVSRQLRRAAASLSEDRPALEEIAASLAESVRDPRLPGRLQHARQLHHLEGPALDDGFAQMPN